MDILTSVK